MHLGIYIQSNLSWDKQVSSNVMKENPKLSIPNSVKGLYGSVRSSIDYGNLVVGRSLNQAQLKNLDNLNYRAAKLVTGALKYASNEKLLELSNTITL